MRSPGTSSLSHTTSAAPVIRDIAAPGAGFVSAIDTRAIGVAVVALGGGRTRPQDPVDHAVGLTDLASIGTALEKGDPIAIVHSRTLEAAELAKSAIVAAYGFSSRKPEHADVIIRRITA